MLGDDYVVMVQVLVWCYKNVQDVEKIFDILFIDGGKGQLFQVEQFFEEWFYDKKLLLIGVVKGIMCKFGLEMLILVDIYDIIFMNVD